LERKTIRRLQLLTLTDIHSFIPIIYIAPLQETYSEALSVQLYDILLNVIKNWIVIFISV